MGRPSDNPKTTRIEMRAAPDEKDKIMEFAKKHNISLLDLLKKGIEAVEKEISG